MDIFFYEAFEEETEAIRRHLPPHIQAGFSWKTIQEYANPLPAAPLISIRTQSQIPHSWAKDLAGILTRSTGYDHIQQYRKATGVDVSCGYLPLYCNRAVAEQALLLWMALLRKLPRQIKNFAQFHRDGITGQECEHKTLLVVGVGHIGYEVTRIGRGLGMTVLGVDIVKKHPDVTYVTLGEGLAQADIIVCSMNLTEDNVAYFDYDCLKQAPSGALFVNVARGELSPTHDLLRLLQEGHLGGVGMDVYSEESDLGVSLRSGVPSDNPDIQATLKMASHPNVIFTPHNAFNTLEAVERKAAHSIQQIEHFMAQDEFLWPVP